MVAGLVVSGAVAGGIVASAVSANAASTTPERRGDHGTGRCVVETGISLALAKTTQ